MRDPGRRRGRVARGVVLTWRAPQLLAPLATAALLAAPGGSLADTPDRPLPPRLVPWQDPAPFARPFLQLPFDAPEILPPGRTEIALRTLYGNTIAQARTSALSLDVEVETAQPMAVVRQGVGRGIELELAIPGMLDYAGFLARPIKVVESLFDAVNPLRVGPPPQAAHFRLLRPDGAGVDWSGTRGSAGDVWAGVKARIRDAHGWVPALSWRAAVKAPTASVPFGSGTFDIGGGLLCAWTFGETAVRVVADLVVPTGSFTRARIGTGPHGTVQIGASRRLARWLSATLQGSVHGSALHGTGMDQLDGGSWYLLAGVAAEPSRSTAVTFALVENVLHASQGADITALLELSWRR